MIKNQFKNIIKILILLSFFIFFTTFKVYAETLTTPSSIPSYTNFDVVYSGFLTTSQSPLASGPPCYIFYLKNTDTNTLLKNSCSRLQAPDSCWQDPNRYDSLHATSSTGIEQICQLAAGNYNLDLLRLDCAVPFCQDNSVANVSFTVIDSGITPTPPTPTSSAHYDCANRSPNCPTSLYPTCVNDPSGGCTAPNCSMVWSDPVTYQMHISCAYAPAGSGTPAPTGCPVCPTGTKWDTYNYNCGYGTAPTPPISYDTCSSTTTCYAGLGCVTPTPTPIPTSGSGFGLYCPRENDICLAGKDNCQTNPVTPDCNAYYCKPWLGFFFLGNCEQNILPPACDPKQVTMTATPGTSVMYPNPIVMQFTQDPNTQMQPTGDTFTPDGICSSLNCTPAKIGTFTWTHSWRNCPPLPIGCSSSYYTEKSNICQNQLTINVALGPLSGQNNNLPCGTDLGKATCNTALGKFNTGDPAGFIKTIYTIILGLAGTIIILLILYAGYLLMTSEGDKQKIQAAREIITAAITGLLFIVFAFVIYQVLVVSILQVPGVPK